MVRMVKAVFENGKFRPLDPTPFVHGEELVMAVVSKAEQDDPYLEKLRSAATLEEMFEIANTIPNDPEDTYDLVEALNENRKGSRDAM
jgi:predicted DNA-binding antitoxin AbrB/MazE fold protein